MRRIKRGRSVGSCSGFACCCAIFLSVSFVNGATDDATLSRNAAQILRECLADSKSDSPTSGSMPAELLEWNRYFAANDLSPSVRERKLRALLDRPISEPIRRVALLDIQSDLAYQSREAQFIRRYGFWSNWFNRITYVGTRAIQGNVQSAGQLVVDGFFDFFRRNQATPAERRAYKLLERMKAEGRATRRDREKLISLRRELKLALAALDLERAKWAMREGSPELASYYAKGALASRPGWNKADAVQKEAEREIAARRRRGVASAQAGYPDRQPPIFANSPDKLRGALTGEKIAPSEKNPNEAHLIRLVESLDPTDRDWVTTLRGWAKDRARADSPLTSTQWVESRLTDARFNPEVRLARARADQRANALAFVFLGPQSADERAYAASSRFAQMWNALANVGVFYAFEFAYRAGIAVWSPPSPAAEAFNAQAAFLRAAPENPNADSIARNLANQYRKTGRFNDARETLESRGKPSKESLREIDESEARHYLTQAEGIAPDDPRRAGLLEKVEKLAPGSRLAESARKAAKKKASRKEPVIAEVAWKSLSQWIGEAAPAGLPGDVEWFDGKKSNGEVKGTFEIEAEGAQTNKVTIRYDVALPVGRRAVEEEIETEKLSAELAAWIHATLEERAREERQMDRLGRLPVPFEFTGGAGLSGVDFYPKLLPIESPGGQTRLYQDAK